MTTADEPAAVTADLREAARLMRERAEAATPGPWERPLDTRYKNGVIAALPEDEGPRSWKDGIIPADFAHHKGITGRYAGQRERVAVVSASAGMLGFDRKRSGRDLEHIASMHPGVALAVADWLESEARNFQAETYRDDIGCPDHATCDGSLHDALMCQRCDEQVDGECACWVGALAVARAYLGTTEGSRS